MDNIIGKTVKSVTKDNLLDNVVIEFTDNTKFVVSHRETEQFAQFSTEFYTGKTSEVNEYLKFKKK